MQSCCGPSLDHLRVMNNQHNKTSNTCIYL